MMKVMRIGLSPTVSCCTTNDLPRKIYEHINHLNKLIAYTTPPNPPLLVHRADPQAALRQDAALGETIRTRFGAKLEAAARCELFA